MSIDDTSSGEIFSLYENRVLIRSRAIAQATTLTMSIDIRSDYWEENYITASFEFIDCESYYYRSEENINVTMSTNSYSKDLTLGL